MESGGVGAKAPGQAGAESLQPAPVIVLGFDELEFITREVYRAEAGHRRFRVSRRAG